jgi:hypothetical protein
MNILLYSEVYALATLATQSIDTALVAFIRAGKESIWSKLGGEEHKRAEQIKAEIMAELLGDGKPV